MSNSYPGIFAMLDDMQVANCKTCQTEHVQIKTYFTNPKNVFTNAINALTNMDYDTMKHTAYLSTIVVLEPGLLLLATF